MNIIGQALAGFLTGVFASMGLGGGFVLVVWLTLFMNVDQRAAQGINVLFFLPIAFAALIMHIKNDLINKELVKKLLFGGVVGAAVGTLGAQIVANELLRKLFAVFLIAFGLREIFSAKSSASADQKKSSVKQGD
ncbi:MAG: sulfite exporter TauE/SafE family protein [Oscillospiraceae bacterium]|nr:sulfite exporter TauE/SafE family protein [Oscillospiraceae bacterium]